MRWRARARSVHRTGPGTVKRLSESIDKIGLRHPITVKERGDRYVLIAGRHRIAAYEKLRRDHIHATIVSMNKDEARLISENLHRAELTKVERDEQIAEWVKITEGVLGQVDPKPQGGTPEGGIRAAARELGIDRKDAERALKVASLSDEAKQAARETGLDNNRSALLAAAREESPPAQVTKLRTYRPATARKDPVDAVVSCAPRQNGGNIEVEGLANAIRNSLFALGPIIDRVNEIGPREFWLSIRQKRTRVELDCALGALWRFDTIRSVYAELCQRRSEPW
jgi:ParB-like chromosome segregation protein Spo0J